MPLTATGPDGHDLDATDCPDSEWAEIHRRRPRVDLHCRGCGAPMHAKVSSAGSRFFAHDALNPICPSLGETPQHRELKRRIASIVRELGCHAEIEAIPSTGDHGGWRADVLGISPDGRRVAFEIQLAPMTIDEGAQRTARYERDGVQCVWITPRPAHWVCSLPSCRITDENGRLIVDRGLGRLGPPESSDRWLPASPTTFEVVALGLLRGRITTASQVGFVETIGDHVAYTPNATLLVPTDEAAALKRAHAAQARRQSEHAANLTALYQRQERVLQLAIEDAALVLEPGCIWLGVPPAAWDGAMPIERTLARGSDATGGGAAIWGTDRGGARSLWAVVCPVATKTTTSLGRSWKRRRVRVYTETRKEAERLAAALGWKADDLVIRALEFSGATCS